MGLHGNRQTIIKDGSTITPAEFTGFTFYNVYAGAGGGAAIINGTSVNLGAGSDLPVVVRTFTFISGSTYLLGDKLNVSYGSPIMGGSFTGNQ